MSIFIKLFVIKATYIPIAKEILIVISSIVLCPVVCLVVFLPMFTLQMYPQYNNVKMCGLWERIKTWENHPHEWDEYPCKMAQGWRTALLPFCLLPCEDTTSVLSRAHSQQGAILKGDIVPSSDIPPSDTLILDWNLQKHDK
jgi:hypothetical protein